MYVQALMLTTIFSILNSISENSVQCKRVNSVQAVYSTVLLLFLMVFEDRDDDDNGGRMES